MKKLSEKQRLLNRKLSNLKSTAKRTRQMVSKKIPKHIIQKFKDYYRYDPLTGNISSELKSSYDTINSKGYRGILSRSENCIEYVIVYHRLVWLLHYGEILEKDQQIDHIDNDKLNNKIDNLRVVTNAQNSYKRGLDRVNNTSGYKGVTYSEEFINSNKQKKYKNYVATIAKDNKKYKIGRFKEDKLMAAKFYDSANRFLYGEFANPNFDEVFIPPMSIEDLRKLKKIYDSPFRNGSTKKIG